MQGHFPVHEANRPVLRAFLAARTQWRTGAAGATGLDYGALERPWRALGIDYDAVFEGVQVMELAILEAWARERAR